jgi:hypothetical protein
MKQRIMNTTRVCLAMAVLGLAGAVYLAQARPPINPLVIPPQATLGDKSYGEWAGQWWQWGWAIPAAVNPMNDPTGQYAATGQSGSVWFLAGTQNGDAERTVSVPVGKALFFPIVNTVWVNLPDLGDNPWSPEQEVFAREYIGAIIDTAYDLSCEIDGQAVKNLKAYRCQTPPGEAYMVQIPAGDIWGLVGLTTVGGGAFQPGTYGPTVDDGIYLMLPPLPVGKHTIHFTGGLEAFGGFHLDVTYHLTVLPPSV